MKFWHKLIVTSITGMIMSSVPVKTEAANIRGSAIFGVPGNVELGNFVVLTFTADEPITLDTFSFDFSGSNAIIDPTGFNVTPPDFSDVDAYYNSIINDRQFSSNLNGFESGETVVYTFDFDQASTQTGTPLGSDYVNGTIDVTFSDGTNLTAKILETDELEGTANFRHNNFSLVPVILPELQEIIDYIRENGLVILVGEEDGPVELQRVQNFEIAATTSEPVSIFSLLFTGGLVLKAKKNQKS